MASQLADGHVYAPINFCSLICNMQLNVLNDLAEAMKALDGKKWLLGDEHHVRVGPAIGWSVGIFMQVGLGIHRKSKCREGRYLLIGS